MDCQTHINRTLRVCSRNGQLKQGQVKAIRLGDAKSEIGMDDFAEHKVFFGRHRLEHFSWVLCIVFSQVHNDVFHARLLDAMGCRNHKLSRHCKIFVYYKAADNVLIARFFFTQNSTALILGYANVCLPRQRSKLCNSPADNAFLNGVLYRTWYAAFELVLDENKTSNMDIIENQSIDSFLSEHWLPSLYHRPYVGATYSVSASMLVPNFLSSEI